MILSFKMKGDVTSDHFLMLCFQKDSLDTVGFRTFRTFSGEGVAGLGLNFTNFFLVGFPKAKNTHFGLFRTPGPPPPHSGQSPTKYQFFRCAKMKGLENYSFVVSSGIGVYMLRRETVSERVCDARRPQTPNTHAINSPATRMTIDNTRNFTTLI